MVIATVPGFALIKLMIRKGKTHFKKATHTYSLKMCKGLEGNHGEPWEHITSALDLVGGGAHGGSRWDVGEREGRIS